MSYSERTIKLKNEYLESLKQDVLSWLNNFFDDLKTKSETLFSKIVVYVVYEPQGVGINTYIDGILHRKSQRSWQQIKSLNTYIDSILLFDENKNQVEVPNEIRNEIIYNNKLLCGLEDIYFIGKIEYSDEGLKMFDGVFDEE